MSIRLGGLAPGLVALALGAAAPSSAPPFPVSHYRAQGLDDLRAERTKGSADAPVTMYEISDFECPYCAEFWRETLPALEREYVATGKVRLIFVNMPISQLHPNAEPAAELAMCAAKQHKFWQMHDLLFRHQDQWADLQDPAPYFLALGDSAGANPAELRECLSTKAMRPVVEADYAGALRSGANSTPTFYIEGGLLRGAHSIQTFRTVLDSIIRTKAK